MSKMLLRLLSTLPLLFASPVWADFRTGNMLLEDCSSELYIDQGVCLGYVMAITDVLNSNNLYGFSACVPTKVIASQVADVVQQWLLQNPQERHYAGNSLVALALSEAFPCN